MSQDKQQNKGNMEMQELYEKVARMIHSKRYDNWTGKQIRTMLIRKFGKEKMDRFQQWLM